MPRIPVRRVASSSLPVGKYCPVLPVAVLLMNFTEPLI
jgi:hypothetical protein